MYILNLNIQCLTNKIDEFSILLKDGKYDVLTLTETWMTNEILLSINIPGYKVSAHYCRQNLKHGGVAILLKSNQNYKKLQIAEKISRRPSFRGCSGRVTDDNSDSNLQVTKSK